MIFKKDNLRLGLVLGLVAPIISLVDLLFCSISIRPIPSERFFYFLRTNKPQMTAVSVPCLVANIALFTYYINSHKDSTAKGIFVATILYAIAALLFKFV